MLNWLNPVFFERAGVMDETAPEFEQKMVQFVDWYLCSRKLSQSKLSPIKDALGNSNTTYRSHTSSYTKIFQTIDIRFSVQ